MAGGLAANLYRDEVRATEDVDFAVILDPPDVQRVVAAAEADGWTVESNWKQGGQLRMRREGYPRVDAIIAGTPFERSAIESQVQTKIGRVKIPALSPESLIVMKLVAGRARDIDAVASILTAMGGDLDLGFIAAWVAEFGCQEAWGRAREESGF